MKFEPANMDSATYSQLLEKFGKNKILPRGYEKHALRALSFYPELQDARIRFKFRRKGAPFVSRPVIWDTFFKKPQSRTYLVFIRTKKTQHFSSFQLENIPDNALIGVFGHELAHAVDFQNRNFFRMLGVIFGNMSRKYLDKMEYETDNRTIEHGLGFQLLAWNTHGFGWMDRATDLPGNIQKMIDNERYMKPSTIVNRMISLPIYAPYLKELEAKK